LRERGRRGAEREREDEYTDNVAREVHHSCPSCKRDFLERKNDEAAAELRAKLSSALGEVNEGGV
jgi:hypothetical protein